MNQSKTSPSYSNQPLKSTTALFEKNSLFKALNKVVFLSVMVAFMGGLYVFIDQIMLVQVLPNNPFFREQTFARIALPTISNITPDQDPQQLVTRFQNDPDFTLFSVIRVVNATVAPITLLNTAFAVTMGLGTGTLYSKAIGKHNFSQVNQVWTNSFYGNLVFSTTASVVTMGLVFILIPIQSGTNEFSSETAVVVQNFLNAKRDLEIEYATHYALILAGGNLLNITVIWHVALLNSEGKNLIATIIVLVSNVLNIGLDYLLLANTVLTIYGSAVATIISYVVANTIFVGYILLLNKQKQTYLLYGALNWKKLHIDKEILFLILAIGAASFLRNATTALADLANKSWYGEITQQTTNQEANYYLDILGAITPVYNLFFSALIGVIRGARTVITYNYGANKLNNVKKAFWISLGLTWIYAFVFFLVVGVLFVQIPVLANLFLQLFNFVNANNSPTTASDATFLLTLTMAQTLFFPLSISGMLYFQATTQNVKSLLASITNGLLTVIMVSIFSQIALATNNITVYMYAPILASAIAGLLIFVPTVGYIHFYRPKFLVAY